MAAAIATLTVGNSWDSQKYFVGGTVAVSASPATYTAGGIAFNLNQSDVKASRTPSDVQIQGIAGYIYSYKKGTDNSNGLLMIFAQTSGAAEDAPLGELTDGSAIPAGVSGDTISFQGRWKGML
jgi:hypothetical protein